jgi:REP element-mobilizing transposase RayT
MARGRENEPPMPEPLAYFLTWSTYGTWLPGDARGWIQYGHGWQLPDVVRKMEAEARMAGDACRLDAEQRVVVERQVVETCNLRGWELHAVNCRSNHLHVVVTADEAPKIVRNQLKAWCTRRLKEMEAKRRLAQHVPRGRSGLVLDVDASSPTRSVSEDVIREKWWAERGSQRFINDSESLEAAILYVRDGQDHRRGH